MNKSVVKSQSDLMDAVLLIIYAIAAHHAMASHFIKDLFISNHVFNGIHACYAGLARRSIEVT